MCSLMTALPPERLPPLSDLSAQREHWLHAPTLYGTWADDLRQGPYLEHAVAHHEGAFMWAEDLRADQGHKRYGAGGFDAFWERYHALLLEQQAALVALKAGQQPARRHLTIHYEIIKTSLEGTDPFPCHLVLDVDLKPALYTGVLTFSEIIDTIVDGVARLFEALYGFAGVRDLWRVTQLDSSGPAKWSRHLIFRLPDDLMFARWADCGAFVRRLVLCFVRERGPPAENPLFCAGKAGEQPESILDVTPYTQQRAMRLLGSSKKGQLRFLRLVQPDGSLLPLERIERQHMLDTMCQYVPSEAGAVRRLYCTECNGVPPVYTNQHIAIFRGELDVPAGAIDAAGGVPADAIRRRRFAVASAAEPRPHRTYSTHVEDIEHAPEHAKRYGKALRDRCLQHLGLEQFYLKWSARYRRFTVQLRSTACPITGRDHYSNNICYNILVRHDAQPLGFYTCFGCPGERTPPTLLPFFDDALARENEIFCAAERAATMFTVSDLFPMYAAAGRILV